MNTIKCPICQQPVEVRENNPFLPFCSERHKMLDFGKWLDGKYVIPDDHPASLPDSPEEAMD